MRKFSQLVPKFTLSVNEIMQKVLGRNSVMVLFLFFPMFLINVIELIFAFVWSLSLNLWNPHEMVLFLTGDKHKDLLIINRGGEC